MFSVLGIIRLLLSLADKLSTYANNRQLIKAGEAKELARQMEITSAKINKAAEARESVRVELTVNPDKLYEDDGYRRD